MISKILIAIGFLFLLVTVGPWVIDTVTALLQGAEDIKNSVRP